MSKRAVTTLFAAFLLWTMAPGPVSAQEQSFYACYVPEVGAMYLIGLSGLPTECLSSEHVEISWTEGGATVTDHGELTGLSDDDHPEYVREGEPAGGDLAGTFPDPSVAALRGNALSSTTPSAGQVLIWNDETAEWGPQAPPDGVTDHGNLGGLSDDDHPQYLLADGTRALTGNLSVGTNRLTDLGAATGPGDAVRFEQAVKGGDAAAGDLTGTFPDPSVAGLQGNLVATTAPSGGQVLTWNGTNAEWEPQTPSSGVTDHGDLSGLADDDHPEYVREGEAAGGDLGGTFPSPAVAALQGNAVASTAPTDGQVLAWNPTGGSLDGGRGEGAWEPQTPSSGVTDHGNLSGLTDDDHAQYLLTDGVRDATGGFAVTGTRNTGVIPVEGAGARVMWYPQKVAFRAGEVLASQWDDTNVGVGSAAFGVNTTASGNYSTAMGIETTASGLESTAMGAETTASSYRSTALGSSTTASGYISTALGASTTASGDISTAMGISTTASGDYSTAMGTSTTASGNRSTAMGAWASTNGHRGTFVYGDRSTTTDVLASANNQFVVRAQHIWLGTNNSVSNPTGHFLTTSTGAFLSTGGTWTDASSRIVKENLRAVDPGVVLEQVTELPVHRWNYRAESPDVEHIGPMAEDFHAAFGLGADDEHIAPLDVGGVSLLSIQALEERTREQEQELEKQAKAIQALEGRTSDLREALRAEREARRRLAKENQELRVHLDSIEERLDGLEAHGNR